MFRKLKQVGQALSPDAIRQGLAASRETMATGGRLTPEQLAAMPPEVRAQYDASMAQVQAGADAAIEAELARRVLLGPAGDYLYGPLPDRERMTDLRIGQQLEHAKADFKDVLRNPLGRRPDPPQAAAVVADAAAQVAHERAARDEARTPYVSPDRWPVTFTRIATDPKRSLEDLAVWLGTSGLAARPDLVYGVYRVPDHIRGGFFFGSKAALVEWTVLHAATDRLPPAPAPTAVYFDARDTWVARRPGEPSILDEDLGLEYFRGADLGPEQCLGIARDLAVDAGGGGENESAYALIGAVGLIALHPPGLAAGAVEQMRAARPLAVPPVPGVRVEVLNWREVARAVAPRSDRRFLVPSPFPYLPSTADELLQAYLEVVGVQPADCYSAQVTGGSPSNIIGGGAHVTTTESEKEVAADGQLRQRLRGGSRVVVAYRDSPEYVAGRERWAAYQHDVLLADLSRGMRLRAPVDRQSALDRGGLGRLVRGAEVIGNLVDEGGRRTLFDKVPDYRYCWPPVQ